MLETRVKQIAHETILRIAPNLMCHDITLSVLTAIFIRGWMAAVSYLENRQHEARH